MRAHRDAYNFPLRVSRSEVFRSVVVDEISWRRNHLAESPLRMVDIGCGGGIDGKHEITRRFSELVDEFWGIEPDESVGVAPGIFNRVVRAPLESAGLPSGYFQIAYAYYVAEHIDDPKAFLAAARLCLAPGGVLILYTPNADHFFGRISRWLRRLRLDEIVLRVVRPSAKVDEYHYPVHYRMNTTREIETLAAEAGFARPQFAYFENPSDTLHYFPPGTQWFWRMAMRSRHSRKDGRRLVQILARMCSDERAHDT